MCPDYTKLENDWHKAMYTGGNRSYFPAPGSPEMV